MIPKQSEDDFVRTTEVVGILSDFVLFAFKTRVKVGQLVTLNLRSDFVESVKTSTITPLAFQLYSDGAPNLQVYVKRNKLFIKTDKPSVDLASRNMAKISILLIGRRWDTYQLNRMMTQIGD